MIHYVVEKHFKIKEEFYGQLKAGANINFELEHNDFSREIADKTDIWQTESMVEALQSLLWSGNSDFGNFMYLTEQACSTRNIPIPKVTAIEFKEMVDELSR